MTTEGSGQAARATLWEVNAATGKKRALLAKPELPAAGSDEKPKPLPLAGCQWNADGTALLISAESDLWLWRFDARAGEELRRLTRDAEPEQQPRFSPDGRLVAYVKKNDLYTLDLATGTEKRLTTTGSETVLNGVLDWVYEEELANRRSGRSFEWAPDSASIAYLRLDESRVPEVAIASLALLVGIDRFMSECRALTNLVSNGVAALVVARWEGELDLERLRAELSATSPRRGPAPGPA